MRAGVLPGFVNRYSIFYTVKCSKVKNIQLRTQIFKAVLATWSALNNLNWYLKNVFPQVLVVMSIQVNRSCSRYITSMATLRLRWTSSQVITVTLFTRVSATDQRLVTDTTCTYPTTLQATAIPTPTVAGPTTSPLGTLHITLPVNFMQDPTNSLPLMSKCFTRQQLKPCKGGSRLPIQAV